MTNKSKSNWITTIGAIVAVLCFFLCIFLFGENMIGVIVGLIISLPISIFTIIISSKIAMADNPNLKWGWTSQTIIRTVTTYNDPPKECIPYDKLNLPPITLSPSANYIYAGMKETVSSYLPQRLDALITVGFDKLGGDRIGARAIMQFLNYANFSGSNETSVALYFYPACFSNDVYDRFKRNPFLADFLEDNDQSFIAEYGKDFDKAVKVASYILATVYYIPIDTQLEYSCDAC